MIRAVIDTNVVVSGLLSPAGNEALILLAIHQGLVQPCFSEEILDEYAAVLARPKFAFPPDEIAAVLTMFRRQGELFVPAVSAVTSSDPGDTKFLQCAGAAQADYIGQQTPLSSRSLRRDSHRERRRTPRSDHI